MFMNLFDPEPIVIEIIETGVGELRIETAQFRQIERIVLSVVEAGQKPHQAPSAAGSRMSVYGSLDHLQRRRRPNFDLREIPIERIELRIPCFAQALGSYPWPPA